MKALVYHGPHQLRWEDWPEQPPEPGEAIIGVRAVGICGSDVHGYTGESGRRTPPMVMGHEATGEVIALGPGVPEHWLGKRVIVQPFLYCGTCDHCQSGQGNLCRNRRLYGATRNGAMAERIAVPVSNLLPLPESLSFVHGTLTEPFAVALHAARQAGDLTGRSVLIAGGGPIGLLILVAVTRAGARQVVVTDLIEKRLALARDWGAAALDPRADGWRERLGRVVGSAEGEVDLAFDAVGIAATFQQALDVVRKSGTVIAVGGWQTVPINLAWVVAREIQIRGTFNYTPDDFGEARRLLAEGLVDPARLVTDIYPMAEGAEVFARLARSQGDNLKVVLTTSEVDK